MTRFGRLLTRTVPLLGLLVLRLVFAAAPASAGTPLQYSCSACQTAQTTLEIDPTSYKVWPSGSHTFVNAQWSSQSGSASFTVRNTGSLTSSAFTATAEVSNHNPLTQQPVDDVIYQYPIPSLAPAASMDVAVPLDPSQCDIFVTVRLGNGQSMVLRTGNPATC
jgi:hypothetical protein